MKRVGFLMLSTRLSEEPVAYIFKVEVAAWIKER
jgi:hypothetical protein